MSSFLTQLATLRDFLHGMGFHVEGSGGNDGNLNSANRRHSHDANISVSERELRDTLKNCGYNVELALERVVTSLSSSGGGGGGVNGGGIMATSSASTVAAGSDSRNTSGYHSSWGSATSSYSARESGNGKAAGERRSDDIIMSSRSVASTAATATILTTSSATSWKVGISSSSSSSSTSTLSKAAKLQWGAGGASTTTAVASAPTSTSSKATSLAAIHNNSNNNTNKRLKINHGHGGSVGAGTRYNVGVGGGSDEGDTMMTFHNITSDHNNPSSTTINNNPKRLLLCKRWTVATSTNPQRGGCNVRYGEMLDFGENFSTTTHQRKGLLLLGNSSTSSSSSSGKKMKRQGSTLVKDPMVVRFRSYSSSTTTTSRNVAAPAAGGSSQSGGNIQGTLNRYLSSILSPLLRYLPDEEDTSYSSSSSFHHHRHRLPLQLISIEGKTMMEDYGLVIGSEIPIVLEIYINDPVRFFGLFQTQQQHDDDVDEVGGGPSYLTNLKTGGAKKKKGKGLSDNGYVAEAAFRLLQWAEKGGEEEEAFVLAQENVVGEESKKKEREALTSVKKSLDMRVSRSSISSFNDDDDDGDDDDDFDQSGRGDCKVNGIVLEEEGEVVVVDEEDVDNKFNQLLLSSSTSDDKSNDPLLLKALPELSDPKGFRRDIALRPYQRQALYFMCRREGVFIKGEMGQIDHDDDVDKELNLILAEKLTPSVLTLAKGNDTLERVWDGDEDAVASCTCGPVVVRDETVASSLEYNGSETNPENPNSRKRGKYIQHPLWQQRYLVAANDFNSVFAFYVNELMGIASARPPKPPKQCCGGILADAMGLGKTVMLLALILKTKEQEEVEEVGAVSQENQNIYTNPSQTKRVSNRKMVASNDKSESVHRNDHCDDDDGESWSDERDSTMAKGRPSLKVEKSNGTTLVIAPLSLISQWEEELSTKTNLSHILYYDLNTKRIDGYDFASVDVVITTYGTVQSLFESFSRSGSVDSKHPHSMFNFGWKRIILDEAHVIKNPATFVSKACCTLQSETRWCVTGTPIQNSLQDVYGLLKFLRHEPWCGAAFWRNAITDPVDVCNVNSSDENNANDDTKDFSSIAAFGRVRRLLAPILLRRTKSTLTADGTPIITLPPIDYSVVHVTLSTPEREFYNALLERSQSIFEGFLSAGTASKSWFAIFSLLQRLRQACDHVSLTVSKNTSEVARSKNSTDFAQIDTTSAVDNDFLSGLLMKFNNKSNGVVASANGESTFAKQVAETLSKCVRSSDEFLKSECPICLDEPRVEDAVYTPCAHMFCRDCLLSVFREQMIRAKKTNVPNAPAANGAGGGNCPVCHSFVNQSFLVQISRSENGEAVSKFLDPLPESEKENSPEAATETKPRVSSARVTLESAINGAGSSKLYSILSELEKVRNDGKVLIFSQYLGFLDIIGTALHKLCIECFRIDGCMSLKERVSAMGRFNKSRSGSVFLISMKAGGVGLNLVAASTVFIVDPWWNQALEDQCINRIHRIGQRAKIVRVRKFVVTDSVEEKIVNLQGKKKGMANVILSEVDDGYRLDGAAKPSLEDFKLLLGRY